MQIGSEKSEKMHIGKKHVNSDICVDSEVDVWEDKLVVNENGKKILIDKHIGKEKMKTLSFKKYLGQVIQSNGKNDLNIKGKTDKVVGNMSKIKNALCERPYRRRYFKAALLMCQAMLLGGLLTNAESWNHLN